MWGFSKIVVPQRTIVRYCKFTPRSNVQFIMSFEVIKWSFGVTTTLDKPPYIIWPEDSPAILSLFSTKEGHWVGEGALRNTSLQVFSPKKIHISQY